MHYLRLFSISIFLAMLVGCGKADQESEIQSTPTARSAIDLVPTATYPFLRSDGGFLSEEPCGPPCFYGIVPGTTTKSEVVQILTNLGIFDSCTFFDSDQLAFFDAEVASWDCGWTSFYYRMTDETVYLIRIRLSEPVPLSDIIAVHGEPSFVKLVDTGLPETPEMMATVCYPDLFMTLPLSATQDGFTYLIESTTIIDSVMYYDRESFRENTHPSGIEPYHYWFGYGAYGP